MKEYSKWKHYCTIIDNIDVDERENCCVRQFCLVFYFEHLKNHSFKITILYLTILEKYSDIR